MRCAIVVLSLLFALPARSQAVHSPSAAPDAKKTFAELATLVGDWKSAAPGRSTTVSYRLIANGSALVETWTMSPTRQSMTVYTLDGEALIATHYCPQGNAPRLRFTSRDETGASHFDFQDGANLQDPSGSHQHAFWIRVAAAGVLTRSETYIRNGTRYDPAQDQGQAETYERVK